jgi:ubiquinone/menaquinone biosynthesis C-methylase UbiE
MSQPDRGLPDQRAIQARYDFVARWHDVAGALITPHRRDAVRALGGQAGERILDLACGTGINFKRIRSQLNDMDPLIGLDYSPGMLEQARRRVKRGHWPNVSLCLGDAARLPFAVGSFDRVICTYSLRVIPGYRRALDEVVRVLRPGGTLVVVDGKLSEGVTRFLNPLVTRMARGSLSDFGRPLIDEIDLRFRYVQVTEYDFGHTFVLSAHN